MGTGMLNPPNQQIIFDGNSSCSRLFMLQVVADRLYIGIEAEDKIFISMAMEDIIL